MDSSPSRAAGILVLGALATPIIVAVWLYWGTGWGLVAWAAALPLALVPWGLDEVRRAIGRRSRKRRQAAVGSAKRTAQVHRRARGGPPNDRSPAEPRRSKRSGSASQ